MIDFPSSPSVGQIFNSGTGPIYVWDGVAWSLLQNSSAQLSVVPDWLKNLICVRTSTTRVTVGTGSIKKDAYLATNSANIAKDINATWVAGDAVGGMESGQAVAANTSYHLHALLNILSGQFDWMYSPLVVPVNIPNGYIWMGRFWDVYTNASSQIFDFTQVNNCCYVAAVQWFTTTSALAFAVGTVQAALPLPSGIRTKAFVALSIQVVNVSCSMFVSDGDDTAGTGTSGVAGQASNTAGASNAYTRGTAITNLTRGLGRNVSGTSAGAAASIGGWEDFTLPRVF